MDTELEWYYYGAPSRQRVATRGFRALKKRPWIIPAVLSVGAGLLILAVGWPAKDKK